VEIYLNSPLPLYGTVLKMVFKNVV